MEAQLHAEQQKRGIYTEKNISTQEETDETACNAQTCLCICMSLTVFATCCASSGYGVRMPFLPIVCALQAISSASCVFKGFFSVNCLLLVILMSCGMELIYVVH